MGSYALYALNGYCRLLRDGMNTSFLDLKSPRAIMEECEALCSRLTIMVAGSMRCVGSAPHLKLKFGQGYTVKVKLHTTQVPLPHLRSVTEQLKHDINKYFPCAALKDGHVGLLHYQIPAPTIPLSRMFTVLEGLKQTHADVIEDYIISDTTLEEVFMTFAQARAS